VIPWFRTLVPNPLNRGAQLPYSWSSDLGPGHLITEVRDNLDWIEHASASSAGFILYQRVPFAKQDSANGSYRIYSVSHKET